MPTGVGAVCSSSSLVPTEPLPSPSASATLIQQVFSARATRAGVANTSSVPLPMVFAVLAAVTSTLCSPRIPVSNVIYFPLLLRAVWRILFLNTFIRYHILHQNAPCFTLFCKFLFFFLRKRAAKSSLFGRGGTEGDGKGEDTDHAATSFLFSPSLQSASLLRFKNANFLRFKANFINLEQTPKIFKKALTRSIPRATMST